MKISSKCRAKKLGMIYTILGSFSSFLIGKGSLFGTKLVLGISLIGEMQCYTVNLVLVCTLE